MSFSATCGKITKIVTFSARKKFDCFLSSLILTSFEELVEEMQHVVAELLGRLGRRDREENRHQSSVRARRKELVQSFAANRLFQQLFPVFDALLQNFSVDRYAEIKKNRCTYRKNTR